MSLREPPSPEAIGAAEAALKHPLPADYRAFIERHNGGEGWIRDFYVVLDAVEDLPRRQKPWGNDSDSYLIFGSDGAGEILAFDARADMAVQMIPAIGGPQHAIDCAPSFAAFICRLDQGDDLYRERLAKPS